MTFFGLQERLRELTSEPILLSSEKTKFGIRVKEILIGEEVVGVVSVMKYEEASPEEREASALRMASWILSGNWPGLSRWKEGEK